MSRSCTVAAYYFPNYHVDPRNEAQHGPGWTEWELVRRAEPRFPGHDQPKVPLWGHEDEADPAVMAKKIDAAANYGVDAFIFDWYYYDDGPFLERGIEKGLFGAPNNERIRFGVMWANHDWIDIHPAKRNCTPPLLYPGKVTPETFRRMGAFLIDTYFAHPAYWHVQGAPYFSIYDLSKLVATFGSVDATRKALDQWRGEAARAGFANLHLNAVVWGETVLPVEEKIADPVELVKRLGFDSVTSYVWIHHFGLPDFPQTDYDVVKKGYLDYARFAMEGYGMPYFPNVSMGWDSTPRICPSDRHSNTGYPSMATIGGNTPAAFQQALVEVAALVENRPPEERIITVNCWNEWTEGSYLEPDIRSGFAYLEAVREVFAPEGVHSA